MSEDKTENVVLFSILGAGAIATVLAGKYLLKLKKLQGGLEVETKAMIHKVNVTGLDLRIDVRLKNPTDANMELGHPFVKIMHGESTLASSQVKDTKVVIEKFSEKQLDPIMLTVGFLSLATNAPALLKEYRETGVLYLTVRTSSAINGIMNYVKIDKVTLGGGKEA